MLQIKRRKGRLYVMLQIKRRKGRPDVARPDEHTCRNCEIYLYDYVCKIVILSYPAFSSGSLT